MLPFAWLCWSENSIPGHVCTSGKQYSYGRVRLKHRCQCRGEKFRYPTYCKVKNDEINGRADRNEIIASFANAASAHDGVSLSLCFWIENHSDHWEPFTEFSSASANHVVHFAFNARTPVKHTQVPIIYWESSKTHTHRMGYTTVFRRWKNEQNVWVNPLEIEYG